ncbi:hypothetical protein C7H19_07310 [Aphanothece hegewaldii CCALA 016]|uniref:WGxxGxxG-CTERM domain-containing protein n=1 Tax=Aphanothece hegewaldii CCALA 016 TaxID=2107694 RepID=A0A2T1LZF0_9CHRO|nr:WGxxGxxG family protein [Aphanothece hegewaldii]PSF37799.1 hypothetical protein C7H19_07310 [Aphanothece hegewaldii CCALA 016]
MKSSKLSKSLRIGVVATAISTLPMIMPVSAQTSPTVPDSNTPGATNDTTTDTTTTNTYRDDDGFDWGWLGLLGLIGLAGLKRKPEDNTSRRDYTTDPTTTTRTDYR